MSSLAIDEPELSSFFGVEPVRADGDVPWPYNELTYRVVVGPHAVVCTIAPAYLDLSLSVSHLGTELYSFQAASIQNLRYHHDSGVETLEVVVTERERIWLRLRPSLLITQSAGEA